MTGRRLMMQGGPPAPPEIPPPEEEKPKPKPKKRKKKKTETPKKDDKVDYGVRKCNKLYFHNLIRLLLKSCFSGAQDGTQSGCSNLNGSRW